MTRGTAAAAAAVMAAGADCVCICPTVDFTVAHRVTGEKKVTDREGGASSRVLIGRWAADKLLFCSAVV